ncbi:MAG: lysozyme inhibitor LprI family protein [Bacteroidota bacterium]|nr:lysozyme inhibitor LprI family protein [Bacteroidota bacterium]MDP4237150.1 lysozyme inhibitor LprI family protein [Bacteroidota bacterium]
MNKYLCLLLLVLSSGLLKAQEHEFYSITRSAKSILPPDDEERNTQAEMNTSQYPEKVDSVLNYVYRDILRVYADDTVFIKQLKIAEAAWIKYRDAELEAILPPAPPEERGSIYPLCWWEYKISLEKRHLEELMKWYEGEDEGDGCSSYKTPEEIALRRKTVRKK